jgi:predicted ATPase
MAVPFFLGLLAQAHCRAGEYEQSFALLTQALQAVEQQDERWHEAELHRLQGELTLEAAQHNATVELLSTVEANFTKALEIARRQEAKTLELRAAVSLARLWQQQDKAAEAQQLLADVYGWFTEGFDTPDLQDAQALLVELRTA